MKGYSFYQSMHPDGKAHGGSPILISKIQHHDSLHFSTQQIQSTNIIIDDWIGELQISAIYSPQSIPQKKKILKYFLKP